MNNGSSLRAIVSWFAAALVMLLCGCTAGDRRTPLPLARDGVLDCRGLDLHAAAVTLAGEWEWYWQRLIPPAGFTAKTLPVSDGVMPLPGPWNGRLVAGRRYPAAGFATVRLTVLLGKANNHGQLCLRIPFMHSAYRLWIDGVAVASNGQVGEDAARSRPHQQNHQVIVAPSGERMEIVIQVANYWQRSGGMIKAPVLGDCGRVAELGAFNLYFMFFVVGSLFTIALYHFLLYYFRSENNFGLLFGLFTSIIMLRSLLTGEKFLVAMVPALPWELCFKVEYLTVSLGYIIFIEIFRGIFRGIVHDRVCRIIQGVSLAYAAATPFLPPLLLSQSLVPLSAFRVGTALYFVGVVVLAIVRRREDAVLYFAGCFVLFLAFVNDHLASHAIIEQSYLFPVGLLVFMITQSVVTVRETYRRSERLAVVNRDLAIARRIQQSIMPAGDPAVPGLRLTVRRETHDPVAGNYYDYHELPHECLGVILGDVTGRGISAAIVASMMKVGFMMQKDHADDPAAVLRGLNDILYNRIERLFIAAQYLFLDPREGVMRYSSAGHLPGCRCRGEEIIPFETRGFLIGALGAMPVPVIEAPLVPGDRIVLCTEGCGDTAGGGNVWGGEELARSIARHRDGDAAALADGILADMRAWARPRTVGQDITVLVIEIINTQDAVNA